MCPDIDSENAQVFAMKELNDFASRFPEIPRDSREWRSVKQHVWPSIEFSSSSTKGNVYVLDRLRVVPADPVGRD